VLKPGSLGRAELDTAGEWHTSLVFVGMPE